MKRALVIRYGAHGDAIQASSLFPALKERGYKVAVDTTPPGEEVLRHDPHIDMLMVSSGDAVNAKHIEARSHGFDKVILLNEATEGALLKSPDRLDYYWPDSLRRFVCAFNYVEFLHLVAELPFTENRQRFYATPDESVAAQQFKARIRAPLIVWVLAGSAQHKIWPGIARGMVRVLQETGAHIVAVGGPADQKLAESVRQFGAGYHVGFDARVTWMVGTRSMRDVMALGQAADVVVGPETGVLNAVAMEPNAKVVMLSHSTVENLTRDWINTVSIEPDARRAPCWPCHRLHQSTKFCPQDKATEMAACASSIDVEAVAGPVIEAARRAS